MTARKTARKGKTITPGRVFLALALIGSVAFTGYVLTVRDATWKAGVAGRNGRAVVLGLGGGFAAIIGMMCLAGALIGFLLARSG